MPELTFDVDVTWLTLIATVLLPMVTALVTNRVAHPGLKAGVLALLALVTSLVNEWVAADGHVGFAWSSWAATAATVFLGAVGLHYGLLKPAQVTGSQGVIAARVSGGVGSDRTIEGHAPYSLP